LARFDTIFSEHQRAVLGYAMRRTESAADAEDVAAETFTICWRRLETVPVDEPLPWLYAVARRVLANQRRGRGRRERLLSVLRSPDVPTPLQVGDDLDAPAFRALASLSPADQELLRLVAWEELGHGEIARVLGITTNAVAIRLHRARARFAEALKDRAPNRTQVDVTGTERAAWKGEAL
jgi:RNA polymerase sigma-70 factor (ECF subfamily)